MSSICFRCSMHPSGVLLTKRMQNDTCSAVRPQRLCKLQLQGRKHIAHTECTLGTGAPTWPANAPFARHRQQVKRWIWDSPFHGPRSINKSTQSLDAHILLQGAVCAPCLHDLTNSKRTKTNDCSLTNRL